MVLYGLSFSYSIPIDCFGKAPLGQIDVEHDAGDSALWHRSDHAATAKFHCKALRPPQSRLRAHTRRREAMVGDCAYAGRSSPAQGDRDGASRNLWFRALTVVINQFAHHESQHATDGLG